MGSDWDWDVRLLADRPVGAVVSDFIGLARKHGFSTRNAEGTITVFDGDDFAFLHDEEEAIAGVATGAHHITIWSGAVSNFISCARQPDRAGDGITADSS